MITFLTQKRAFKILNLGILAWGNSPKVLTTVNDHFEIWITDKLLIWKIDFLEVSLHDFYTSNQMLRAPFCCTLIFSLQHIWHCISFNMISNLFSDWIKTFQDFSCFWKKVAPSKFGQFQIITIKPLRSEVKHFKLMKSFLSSIQNGLPKSWKISSMRISDLANT